MRTYTELPDDQKEWFDCLWQDLLHGSGYWIADCEYRTDDTFIEDEFWKLTVSAAAQEDVGVPFPSFYAVPRDLMLSHLMVGPAGEWFRGHSREYFRKFGEEVQKGNFYSADYDAEITDCLLQIILFGKPIFG